MDNQGLNGSDAGEMLSVRWANEDPNPVSVVGKRLRAMDALESAALSVWDALPPEEKKARVAAMRLAEGRKLNAVAKSYPDTSAQYESIGQGGVEEGAAAPGDHGAAAGWGAGVAPAAAAAVGEGVYGEGSHSYYQQDASWQQWQQYQQQGQHSWPGQQQQGVQWQGGEWETAGYGDPNAAASAAAAGEGGGGGNLATMLQYSNYWATAARGWDGEGGSGEKVTAGGGDSTQAGAANHADAAAEAVASDGVGGALGDSAAAEQQEAAGPDALGLLAGYGSDEDGSERAD